MKRIAQEKYRFGPFLLSLMLLGLGSDAWTQVTTATILGVVKDASDAILPGVSITVKNADTGISRSVVTDSGGRYRISDLQIGNYEVQANLSGFLL